MYTKFSTVFGITLEGTKGSFRFISSVKIKRESFLLSACIVFTKVGENLCFASKLQ